MKKAILTALTALTALTCFSADRKFDESWDASLGYSQTMAIRWGGGDSIDYTHRARYGTTPVVLTNAGQRVVWMVMGSGTTRSNNYISATGTVQATAGAVKFFVPPETGNLTPGKYTGFVRTFTASGGITNAVTLCYQDITVDWTPESAEYATVEPKTNYYSAAEMDALLAEIRDQVSGVSGRVDQVETDITDLTGRVVSVEGTLTDLTNRTHRVEQRTNDWNTAFSWGDHAGLYLTLANWVTQSNLIYQAIANATPGGYAAVSNSALTAYGWGNHALAGYLISESDPAWHSGTGVIWTAISGAGKVSSVNGSTGDVTITAASIGAAESTNSVLKTDFANGAGAENQNTVDHSIFSDEASFSDRSGTSDYSGQASWALFADTSAYLQDHTGGTNFFSADQLYRTLKINGTTNHSTNGVCDLGLIVTNVTLIAGSDYSITTNGGTVQITVKTNTPVDLSGYVTTNGNGSGLTGITAAQVGAIGTNDFWQSPVGMTGLTRPQASPSVDGIGMGVSYDYGTGDAAGNYYNFNRLVASGEVVTVRFSTLVNTNDLGRNFNLVCPGTLPGANSQKVYSLTNGSLIQASTSGLWRIYNHIVTLNTTGTAAPYYTGFSVLRTGGTSTTNTYFSGFGVKYQ